jgi:hypothetical protein
MITSYQTQDVRLSYLWICVVTDLLQVMCVKCNQSKDDNLAPNCRCGGSFRTVMNRGEMKTRLKMILGG